MTGQLTPTTPATTPKTKSLRQILESFVSRKFFVFLLAIVIGGKSLLGATVPLQEVMALAMMTLASVAYIIALALEDYARIRSPGAARTETPDVATVTNLEERLRQIEARLGLA